MLTVQELQELLLDLESHWVERTVSTTDSDKFCRAICAFSNDMPGTGRPGYLIVGANDDGTLGHIEITDRLLQNLASHRDSGRIVPLPAINVEKVSLPGGDVAVVEVLPSDMPPVRYRGVVHIRTGPRRGIATEHQERILNERRRRSIRSFDLSVCDGCGPDDLAMDLFQLTYRHAAVAPEILDENNRDMLVQMESLGMFDTQKNCATYAGVLLFAESPQTWLPGSYVQFVRYDGTDLSAEVLDERRFDGDLISMLREMDAFLRTLFPKRPVAVSELQEKIISTYPSEAVRELLMNAVMHRDYSSNAPVSVYWFEDRIEIQNPGGLYGVVTPETFPNQNDYRNPKIAEAMKNLGYVNQFRRGIARAQRFLKENGNPEAEFQVDQPTVFLATIRGIRI
jgi:ATP-dependent DNA helicase RecG